MTRGRPGPWVALGVALLVVAVLGSLPLDRGGVRWYAGAVGDTITTPTYGVRVESVATSGAFRVPGGTWTTDHRYVVAEVRYDIRTSRVPIEATLVTAGGLRHAARDMAPAPPPTVQGHSAYGTLVFELPADRIPGASLEFDTRQDIAGYEARVRVPLGPAPEARPVVTLDPTRAHVGATP